MGAFLWYLIACSVVLNIEAAIILGFMTWVTLAEWLERRRNRKAGDAMAGAVGDDTIAMLRQRHADDKVIDGLEAGLAEMNREIRGDL